MPNSIAHVPLFIEKQPKHDKPPETATAEVRLTVKEPTCTLKLAGGKPAGKEWKGLVEYRLHDNPAQDIIRARGSAIDEEGVVFDVSLANTPHGGHELGKIDMIIHLGGSAPLKIWGEIVSISGGALPGHTALRASFRNMKPEAHQRIKAFLIT
jgi:hypothetical protein